MLLLTLVSVALYEVYAGLLGLWPVVIMNGIFLVLVAFELVLKIVFSKRQEIHVGQSSETDAAAFCFFPRLGDTRLRENSGDH